MSEPICQALSCNVRHISMAKDTQIAFRADSETKASLEAAAKAEDRTPSALALRIIKEWLAKRQSSKKRSADAK
jgi:predicted transcriptional regulator